MTNFGTAIHHSIEQLFLAKKDGYRMEVPELQSVFEKKWNEIHGYTTIWNEDSPEYLTEQGKIALQDFHNRFYESINPLELEMKMNIFREGCLPIDLRADIVTTDGGIYDLKTGRGFSGSADEGDYITQLVTYSIGYYTKFQKMPNETAIIKQKWGWKKQPNGKRKYYHKEWEKVALPIDESWFPTVLNSYDIVEAAIKNNIFLPAKDNDPLCRNCSYRLSGHCDQKILEKVKSDG